MSPSTPFQVWKLSTGHGARRRGSSSRHKDCPRAPFNEKQGSRLTGFLALVQTRHAGDVIFSFPSGFWFSGGEKVSDFRGGGLDLAGDGPDKAGEFAGDGGDGDLGLLFAHPGEVDITVVQTALRFPGDVGDGLGQTFLAFF